MFIAAESIFAATVFSVISMLVAMPSAIKVFNWTATLYKASVSLETPMLYALGFIGLFTIGGLTGVMLALIGIDVHVTDTYFVVAHFHYVMVGGAIIAYLGGLHYWWPKITGRMYPEFWAKLAALIVFIGFNLTFFPQFLLGYLGMPRRYHAYPEEFQVLNVLSSAGATVLGFGFLLPFVYLRGRCAGASRRRRTRGARSASSGTPPRRRRPRTSSDADGRPARPTTTSTTSRRLFPQGGAACLVARPRCGPPRLRVPAAPPLRHPRAAARDVAAGHVAVPRPGSPVLRRHLHGLRRLPGHAPGGVRRRQPRTRHQARRLQHRGPDRLELDHGARGPGGAARRRKKLVTFLLLTILLGLTFLGVKVVEYSAKYEHHLIPGINWQWHGTAFHDAAYNANGARTFYGLYFGMTGLHALHMIIGIGILGWMVAMARRGHWTPDNYNFVEGVGLYWHFVDIIWIFLFPLLYLIGRH